jgi:uncharacterized phage infection (PIP) family protein YhgE
MANAGTIAVNLIARTMNFEKGMHKSRGLLKDFDKFAKVALSVGKVRAFTYGIEKLSDGISASIDVWREQGSLAEKLGKSFLKIVPGGDAARQSVEQLTDKLTGLDPLLKGLEAIRSVRFELQGLTDSETQLSKVLKTIDELQAKADGAGSILAPAVFDAFRRKAKEKYDTSAADIAEKQADAMQELLDRLSEIRSKAAGLDDITAALYKMDHELGLSVEQFAKMAAVVEKVKEAEKKLSENMELQSFADRLKEQTKTAIEIYDEQVRKIQEAFDKGLIGYETYTRGLDRLKDDRFAGGGNNPGEGVVFRSQDIDVSGLHDSNPMKPTEDMLREMLSIQRKAFAN